MDAITAVDGRPLAPESLHMLEYLRDRARELNTAAICGRLRSAAEDLENAAAAVTVNEARVRPVAGKWNLAEVIDHIAQTQVRGAEELRHLLAGRRPPLPPVYEALRSGAAQWAPWETLLADLRDANRSMVALLETASDGFDRGALVKTLLVALAKREDGSSESQLFFAELTWKEYALLQRLHLLDHRRQLKEIHALVRTVGQA
jgi:hypothetical protein